MNNNYARVPPMPIRIVDYSAVKLKFQSLIGKHYSIIDKLKVEHPDLLLNVTAWNDFDAYTLEYRTNRFRFKYDCNGNITEVKQG